MQLWLSRWVSWARQISPTLGRKKWERLDGEDDKSNALSRRPTGARETWPNLEDGFEEFVQKYRTK